MLGRYCLGARNVDADVTPNISKSVTPHADDYAPEGEGKKKVKARGDFEACQRLGDLRLEA